MFYDVLKNNLEHQKNVSECRKKCLRTSLKMFKNVLIRDAAGISNPGGLAVM